jgi:hypothetical protein
MASLPGLRLFAPEDAERLARLMLDSYRGTVDDGGETLDDARREVTKLIAGDFGSVDWEASVVVERDGQLSSATIVTRDRVAPPPLRAGEAFVAFSNVKPELPSPSARPRGPSRIGNARASSASTAAANTSRSTAA